MNIVIIGGGSAGTTCAFELRKADKEVTITIIEASKHLEYSPCALPYVLSGEIPRFSDISIFDKKQYSDNRIEISLGTTVTGIDRKNRKVMCENQAEGIPYDALVLASGSTPVIPDIPGLEDQSYHVLKTIDDAQGIAGGIKRGNASAIIGAGIIGIELAVALQSRGMKVTVIESKDHILPHLLDSDMAEVAYGSLTTRGIKMITGAQIKGFSSRRLLIGNEKLAFDMLFVCTGVAPNTHLARISGLAIDAGIVVDRYLRTQDKRIYACGDCAESIEMTSGRKMLSLLGTTAVRGAKTVAVNILTKKNGGKMRPFLQVINTTVTKLGDIYLGSAGLSMATAERCRIKGVFGKYIGKAVSRYYPDEATIAIKIICDRSGKVIGGQIIGERDVVGRLDTLALAIQNQMMIGDLASLETCYNPPSAPIFDPLTIAAEICQKKVAFLQGQGKR